ncbi:type II secretion system F family protein [Blastococcus litoris]|uniref:type II secretion system F family protein n=1 Tax=Blastococcus litoris TaxID=2171622 RepID=UPI001F12EF15|nr:type II secretion system F family protein [Blastococcus litoris]
MTSSLLLLAGAVLLWSPGAGVVSLRARAMRPPREASVGHPVPPLRRRLLAGAAGLAAGLLVGGLLGVGVAVAVAVIGERRLGRDQSPPDHGPAIARALPGACDLMAVCLTAGVPVTAALAAVGAAVPAPLGPELRRVAGLSALGAEARRAWAGAPPELAALGRVLVRAGESGAAAAPALRALAGDARTSARTAAEAAVRRAGVWVLAPLGLCFLPAFVCLGVVPMVLGIAAEVFG